MSEQVRNGITLIFVLLTTGCSLCLVFIQLFQNRWAPVKAVKAKVVDKGKQDTFSKIYGTTARKPVYYIVFSIGDKKRSFHVSEFSYSGYRIGEIGTLKYKGNRIIDFR